MVHLLFNVIGIIIFYPGFNVVKLFFFFDTDTTDK
jgi:hypothetical protein